MRCTHMASWPHECHVEWFDWTFQLRHELIGQCKSVKHGRQADIEDTIDDKHLNVHGEKHTI